MSSSKKAAKKQAASAAARPVSTPLQNSKTSWSSDGSFYAHLTTAVDAHTVRIYAASSGGRCIARWASTQGEKVQSLLWVQLPGSTTDTSKRGKKRRKTDNAEDAEEAGSKIAPQTALALGLDDGVVLLLQPATSTVIYKLQDPSGLATSVDAIACPPHPDGPLLLWTADDAGTLRAFTLEATEGRLLGRATGAGEGYNSALCVRYTNGNVAQVLVSRADIRCIKVALEVSGNLELAQTVSFSAAGHTSEVNAIHWLDEHGAFVSTARGDRTVNLWRPNGDLGALTTLEDPPRSIDVQDYVVAAVTEQGAAAVFSLPKDALTHDSLAPKKKKVATVKIGSRVGPGVRAAQLQEDGRLRIAKGSELKPIFETTTLRDDSGSFLPEIELAATSTSLLIDDDGDVDMGAPIARTAYKEGESTVRSTALADATEDQQVNAGELDVNAAGPTLAERMKSLKIPQVPELDGEGATKDKQAVVPQATLAQTLIQALHSDDRELIEACLTHTNPKLIRATVKRLPTSLVLPLIDNLVERLSRGRRGYGAGAQRGRALVIWLRTCLVVHVGYLVTVEGLIDRLAGFHAALHHRLEAHNQLLGLAGRLELVVSQIELRREAAGRPRVNEAYEASLAPGDKSAGVHAKAPPPVRKYVEGESESSSDSDDDSEDEAEWAGMDVDAGQPDGGEVDDVGLGGFAEDSEDEDDSEEEADGPSAGVNGFLDLHADEASDDESQEDDSEASEEDSGSDEGEGAEEDDDD